jgi:hypothetical protein
MQLRDSNNSWFNNSLPLIFYVGVGPGENDELSVVGSFVLRRVLPYLEILYIFYLGSFIINFQPSWFSTWELVQEKMMNYL